MNQPLSIGDMRAIIAAHPVVFAAIGGAGAITAEDIANRIVETIAANPAVVDTIVAKGMGIDEAAAARLGWTKYLSAIAIAMRTMAAIDHTELAIMMADEMAAITMPGGGSLQ